MVRFQPSQVERSFFADTEAVEDYPFATGGVEDDKFELSIELAATANNNVEVAFGIDLDNSGALDYEETEFIVGWDCGIWFYRDMCSGTKEEAQFDSGLRKLDWTLYLEGETRSARQLQVADTGKPIPFSVVTTSFNTLWNRARVTVRGENDAQECIEARLSSTGFAVSIQ